MFFYSLVNIWLVGLLPTEVSGKQAMRIGAYTRNSIACLAISYRFAIYFYLAFVSPFLLFFRIILAPRKYRAIFNQLPFPAWGLMIRLLKSLALMAYFDEMEKSHGNNFM